MVFELETCGFTLADSGLLEGHFSSVTQLSLTLCNPMDCSLPDFPAHHQLPELAQTHIFRVSSSHQVAKGLEFQKASTLVLPMNIQD